MRTSSSHSCRLSVCGSVHEARACLQLAHFELVAYPGLETLTARLNQSISVADIRPRGDRITTHSLAGGDLEDLSRKADRVRESLA